MNRRIKRYFLNRKIQKYTDSGPMPQEVLNRIMQINGLNRKLLTLIEGKMVTREDHYKRVNELLASNNELLEKYRKEKRWIRALENELTKKNLDADRWRAFLTSGRLRPLGWAGFNKVQKVKDKKDDYLHFGMEFWTTYAGVTEKDNEVGKRLLTNYADHLILIGNKENE